MEVYGLYLPEIFSSQNFDNIHNIPFEKKGNEQYFVSIDFFRNLYKKDDSTFNTVTIELVLRGGEFYLLKSSSLFPKIELASNKIILSSDKTPVNAFKDIDYDLLNIRGFVTSFNIQNNSFFNHIPLEGFKVLNFTSNDIKILENNLIEAGFYICEADSELLDLKYEKSTVNSCIGENKNTAQSVKNIAREPITGLPAEDSKEIQGENTLKANKIQGLFSLIDANPFYDYIDIKNISDKYMNCFFQKNNIIKVSNLKTERIQAILEEFSIDQLTTIYKKMSDLALDYRLMAATLMKIIKNNNDLSQLRLREILDKSSDRQLIGNAYSIGIDLFDDFTMSNAITLFKSRNIGKKKISSLLNIVIDYKNHIKTIPPRLITPVNPGVKKNDAKIPIIKRIYGLVAESTFYQSLHISEVGMIKPLRNSLFDKKIIYLSDLIHEERLDFFYDELSENQIRSISKAIDNITANHDLIASKLIEFIDNNSHIKKIYLKDILDNSTFRIVIGNAKKINIEKLGDFTLENSIKLFKTKGIGKKKLSSFFDFIFNLPDTKAVQILNLSDRDSDEAKYLGYFMLEEDDLKRYISKQKISLVTKSELMHLIINFTDSYSERDEISQSLEVRDKEIKQFDIDKLDHINSYQLSIEEILSFLEIDFILKDLSEGFEVLALPISTLLKNKLKLSSEMIQIILFYIEKTKYFEKIEENLESNPFNLEDRELIIFNERIRQRNSKTLEELAKTLDVTRERVRQIESSIKRKIKKTFIRKKYIKLYQKHLKANGTVILKENDLKNILISIKNPGFHYDVELDLLILSDYEERYNSIKKQIKNIFKINDVIKVKDLKIFINDIGNELNNKALQGIIDKIFQHFFEKNNYIQKNEIIYKENISKSKIYCYMIDRYYSHEVLDFFEEESYNLFMERLRLNAPDKMLEDLSGRPKSNLIRSVESVLERHNDKVLKLDAHQYRKLDVNRIPYALIDDIYDFINEEILNNKFISIKKIYRFFKRKIDDLGYSEKTIYYLLKLLFEDEFNFGGKTSLRIFEKDTEVLSTLEIILTTLDKNNGTMSVVDLAEEIGLEDYSIDQQADPSAFVVRNRIASIVNNEDELSEGTLNVIKNTFINMLEKKGYVPIQQIYDELKFNAKVNRELRENNYTTLLDFTHLLKIMFPNTAGHTRILFHKDSNQDYFDIFIRELGEKDEYHREDFVETGKKLGLSEQTIYIYLNRFIDKGKIVPINSDFFVLPSSLNLGEEELENIDFFLQEKFKDNEHLSLTVINSELSQLSRLNGLRWTIELMNYIATKILSYKKINIKNFQYTVDPMIITLENSNLTYKDIVTLEMKKFNENRTEERILNYLKQKGLLHSSTKRIYTWFFSNGIFVRNDFGRIYLAEEV